MQLTKNFSLEELTYTNRNIDNTPTPKALECLKHTASQMELIRDLLGRPIRINSAYRSPALNKAVGGAVSSQHMLGEAVDFTCHSFGSPREIVKAIVSSSILFDQVICEYNSWVHISFSTNNRKQALNIDAQGTRPFK